MKKAWALGISLLSSVSAYADYGWLPEYRVLVTRIGTEVLSTDSDFGTDGKKAPLTSAGQDAKISDIRVKIGLEYGVAQDWSAFLNTGAQFGSYSVGGADVSSASGITDSTVGLRWAMKFTDPIVTLETYVTFPASNRSPDVGELAITQGAYDLGFRLLTGHKAGNVFITLAPGARMRTQGYSAAATADVAMEVRFRKAFIRIFGNYVYSFDDSMPLSTKDGIQDAQGSGGSFSRLNGSPTGLTVGGLMGFRINKVWSAEVGASQGVMGNRFPNQLSLYGGIRLQNDFFEPIIPKRVREVPFEEDDAPKKERSES